LKFSDEESSDTKSEDKVFFCLAVIDFYLVVQGHFVGLHVLHGFLCATAAEPQFTVWIGEGLSTMLCPSINAEQSGVYGISFLQQKYRHLERLFLCRAHTNLEIPFHAGILQDRSFLRVYEEYFVVV
jgi:hypothetical protein